jgi:hypothetical protein
MKHYKILRDCQQRGSGLRAIYSSAGSSKGVHVSAAEAPGGWCGSFLISGAGPGVELGGCQAGGVFDLGWPGEGLAGECGLAEDAPPAFLEVEPAGADGDEDVPDPEVILQPGASGQAVVRGQVVGDDVVTAKSRGRLAGSL